MNRREFLKLGGSAIAIGAAGGYALFRPVAAVAHGVGVSLRMVEAEHEMVDGVLVPAWAFESDLTVNGAALGARIPGPTIFVMEGETLHFKIKNEIPNGGPHAFAIQGVATTEPIPAGEERELVLTAPAAGTYYYLDPLNAPVNRVLGLHGALVVLPPVVGHRSPYSAPTAAVTRLFDDLGTASHFPGHFWDRDRNAIWIFSTVDPDKHAAAAASGGPMDPAAFQAGYLPQYFMINGKSGFFAAQHGAADPAGEHDHGGGANPDTQSAISIHGHVGQPCLIRNLNAGLMTHSPHIHGNHVYELTAADGRVNDDLFMVDTWTCPPLARKDVLLPYIKPPDIPGASWVRFEAGTNDELFPLLYPMHDHNEISNTAAGGNYPFGLATHFQFDGPVDGSQEVIQVDRAELRIRTGQLVLSGRSSGVALRAPEDSVLMVHAGADATGPSLGTFTPAPDGSWTFRGRALKALSTRLVTVHNHVSGAEVSAIPLTLR